MEKIKVKQLKKGWFINHPKYGTIQYHGLVTKHPYTEEPKIPHQHIFWQCVDINGNTQSDVIELNENLIVEVTDKIQDDE